MTGLSYRRLQRWVAVSSALAGCVAMVSGPGALGPPRPAVAVRTEHVGDASVRILQMNLCNSGAATCYTGRSVAEAAAVIVVEAPDVVTLNEVCQDDVAVLDATMTRTGGGAVVSAFQAAGDRRTGGALRCRNGRPYGIGLVARLPAVPHGYEAVGLIYPVQDPGSAEERAWLCLSPGGAAAPGAVAVCTTHLVSSSPAVAGDQCRYLLDTVVPAVRARAASVPLVLAGDLNLGSAGASDARSCVPEGDQRVDDGVVQHVVATAGLTVGARRTIAMDATDHPGLLVTLALAAGPITTGGVPRPAAAG
jgi:endonuclease/exonuclease/phosphatase family metal-dependent hydrolase